MVLYFIFADLRVLYASSTNQFDALWQLVRDMHKDVLTIALSSDGTNVERNMNSVLSRVELSKFLVYKLPVVLYLSEGLLI